MTQAAGEAAVGDKGVSKPGSGLCGRDQPGKNPVTKANKAFEV